MKNSHGGSRKNAGRPVKHLRGSKTVYFRISEMYEDYFMQKVSEILSEMEYKIRLSDALHMSMKGVGYIQAVGKGKNENYIFTDYFKQEHIYNYDDFSHLEYVFKGRPYRITGENPSICI